MQVLCEVMKCWFRGSVVQPSSDVLEELHADQTLLCQGEWLVPAQTKISLNRSTLNRNIT